MEWDLKMPPWDLAELDRDSVVGGLDCSVDLKLGGFGDFRSEDKWKNQQPTMVSSPASSSKRARPPGNGGQVASCLVDGCISDLSKCREYHRKHKVCEVHSKTAIVLVGGREQRFCQQCSRFHLLVEFDEVKRSCRKRLDGHNRRRRKPQLDSLNTGSLITSHQGPRFTSFPHMLPTPTPEPNWGRLVKTEEDHLYSHHLPLHLTDLQQQQQHFTVTSHGGYKEGKQFPFLQETIDSDCALSLLSSPLAPPQTLGSNLRGQMLHPATSATDDRIPMGQPLVQGGIQYYSQSQASSSISPTGFSCSGMEDDHHVGTVLVSDASDANLHCHGLFHVGGEGSSDGNSQTLPFSWH